MIEIYEPDVHESEKEIGHVFIDNEGEEDFGLNGFTGEEGNNQISFLGTEGREIITLEQPKTAKEIKKINERKKTIKSLIIETFNKELSTFLKRLDTKQKKDFLNMMTQDDEEISQLIKVPQKEPFLTEPVESISDLLEEKAWDEIEEDVE